MACPWFLLPSVLYGRKRRSVSKDCAVSYAIEEVHDPCSSSIICLLFRFAGYVDANNY